MDIEKVRASLRQQEANPLARTVLTQEIDGVTFSIEVAPCSWLYPGYGLQIHVTMLDGGGNVDIMDKTLPFAKATEADMLRLFRQVRVVKCSRCGKPAFDPETTGTNRCGLCEICFIKDLNEELQAAMDKEKKRMARMDTKRRKEGYTHRVDAWVHPQAGSDYQISLYVKGKPTAALIKRELTKLKSQVTNDYTVIEL